jgi:hypothetical protein
MRLLLPEGLHVATPSHGSLWRIGDGCDALGGREGEWIGARRRRGTGDGQIRVERREGEEERSPRTCRRIAFSLSSL